MRKTIIVLIVLGVAVLFYWQFFVPQFSVKAQTPPSQY